MSSDLQRIADMKASLAPFIAIDPSIQLKTVLGFLFLAQHHDRPGGPTKISLKTVRDHRSFSRDTSPDFQEHNLELSSATPAKLLSWLVLGSIEVDRLVLWSTALV